MEHLRNRSSEFWYSRKIWLQLKIISTSFFGRFYWTVRMFWNFNNIDIHSLISVLVWNYCDFFLIHRIKTWDEKKIRNFVAKDNLLLHNMYTYQFIISKRELLNKYNHALKRPQIIITIHKIELNNYIVTKYISSILYNIYYYIDAKNAFVSNTNI